MGELQRANLSELVSRKSIWGSGETLLRSCERRFSLTPLSGPSAMIPHKLT